MPARILLVYPQIPTTYWSFRYALPFIGKKATMPPLGLLTVAAMLPPQYEAKLVDMNVTALTDADIDACDLAFVSAMLIQRPSFEKVVSRCNARGKPVVAGGPYPSSFWGSIGGVSHFVLDEAESTLPEFLSEYTLGRARKVYRSAARPDIALSPVPRFDLVDVRDYESMALQFSRGCPFTCEFCDIIEMFGRLPRTKRPERFLAELEAVYASGFRGSLFIVDDNFVGNRSRVRELLAQLRAWQREHGFPFSFYTEASIDLAQDPGLLEQMAACGFDMVFVGIETPDRKALALTRKTQNLRCDLAGSVREIQRHGIEVAGGFIVGFDGEAEDIFERQLRFIEQAGIPMAMVGLLIALPNTQLYRRLQREGRLIEDEDSPQIHGNNTHTLSLNFRPQMDREVLLDGYKRLLAELYSPRRYFQRCLALLDSLPPRPSIKRPLTLQDVRAFLRSLFRQGFSPYGLQYLGFLASSLLSHPRLFPAAVKMAVRGHHFFTLTRELLRADAFSSLLTETLAEIQRGMTEALHRGSREQLIAQERRLTSLLASIWRSYVQLGRGVQHIVQDSFLAFMSSCQALLSRLRLACLA